MKRYLSLVNGVINKYEVYEITGETEDTYILNTGKQLFKNDMFIDLISPEQVDRAKYRNDVVFKF